MGGRGAGFKRGNQRVFWSATEVTGSDGATIDLSGNPLIYGDKDPHLTDAARTRVEEFEDKRWKAKTEYLRLVDDSGRIIADNKGGKYSVKSSSYDSSRSDVLTHNHPRTGADVGILGGTFSIPDLNNFVAENPHTVRATASEGTYSISKLSNFDGAGFKAYYTKEQKANKAVYKKTEKKVTADYSAATDKAYKMLRATKGDANAYSVYKATCDAAYKVYNDSLNNAFNSYLVAEHNSFLAGQEKYGYYYTLEGRK